MNKIIFTKDYELLDLFLLFLTLCLFSFLLGPLIALGNQGRQTESFTSMVIMNLLSFVFHNTQNLRQALWSYC